MRENGSMSSVFGVTRSPYTTSRGALASIAAATTAQDTACPRYPTVSTLPGARRSPVAARGGAQTAARTSIAVTSTPAAVIPPCAYAQTSIASQVPPLRNVEGREGKLNPPQLPVTSHDPEHAGDRPGLPLGCHSDDHRTQLPGGGIEFASAPRSDLRERRIFALRNATGAVEGAEAGHAVDPDDRPAMGRVDEAAAADVDPDVAEAVEEDEVTGSR